MKFFFIDLDGTIEDSKNDMTNAAIKARKELNLPELDFKTLSPHVNKGMTQLYLNAFSDFFSEQANLGRSETEILEEVKTIYEGIYFRDIAIETKLYPGMKDVLQSLSNLGKIIVITNKPYALSKELLCKLEVLSFVTDIMGGDSCPENKPSPVPLQLSGQKHGYLANSSTAFMIGDSVADIQCGSRFGARTIWCSYGYASSHGSEKPDFIAHSPAEILRFVE
jgi:phosphoglycolate phosphatase